MRNLRNKTLWKNILLIASFFVLLLLPIGKFFIAGDGENIENKTLQTEPVFNITTWQQYPQAYEQYFKDNLPYKKFFVGLYNQFIWNVFDESPVNYVIKGKDGWLFYNSKNRNDSDELGDYRGDTFLTEQETETIVQRLSDLQKLCDDIGADFYVLVGPNKTEIYGDDYLPDAYIRNESNVESPVQQLTKALKEKTEIPIIYPKEELLSQKDEEQLYYKLDTHWNNHGAYIAYSEFMKRYAPEQNIEMSSIQQQPRISGDLANMIQMNDLEDIDYSVNFRPEVEMQIILDQAASTEDVARYRTISNCNNGQKLLMYRDSFTTALIPYMSKTFDEAYYVWSYSANKDEISEEKPDVVILEIVERSIKQLAYVEWNM